MMQTGPRIAAVALSLGLVLTGCIPDQDPELNPENNPDADATAANGAPGPGRASVARPEAAIDPASVLKENAEYTAVRTDEWSVAEAVDLALDAPGSTITAGGVYRLEGVLQGAIIVDAPEDALVVLVLDGAEISNTDGPAIEVVGADDVALHLVEGSINTVSTSGNEVAAVLADSDLTISGDGWLEVTAATGDGIVATDDLAILSGDITVTAADDALRGQKSLVVEGGTLALTAEAGDGMKADEEDDRRQGYVALLGGRIDIVAGDDGIQAQTDVVITGGHVSEAVGDDGIKGEAVVSVGADDGETPPVVQVTTSTEAMEAANVHIGAGTIELAASDDGINASGNAELQALNAGEEYVDDGRDDMADTGERLEIVGGDLTIDAGGDGIDSNGSLTISGGTTTIHGTSSGPDGALDANGEFTITGGTVLGFGGGQMEQAPTGDGQGWLLASVDLAAGRDGRIVDDEGDVVVEFTPLEDAGSVFYSSAEVSSGASYDVIVDGESVGSATAGEGGMGRGPGGPMGGGRGGPPGQQQEGMPAEPPTGR